MAHDHKMAPVLYLHFTLQILAQLIAKSLKQSPASPPRLKIAISQSTMPISNETGPMGAKYHASTLTAGLYQERINNLP
jgi:hypothetical protein